MPGERTAPGFWHGALDWIEKVGSNYTVVLENDATGKPIYLGFAAPGTSQATTGWQIRKFTLDGNGNLASIAFASGTQEFDKIWNNRAGYAYS